MQATALAEFHIDRPRALALIDPSFSQQRIGRMDLDNLSRILDYGWLSDANRFDRPGVPDTPQTVDLGTWAMFEEFLGGDVDMSVDVVGQGMNSLMQRDGRGKQRWLEENSGVLTGQNHMLDFQI